MKTNTKKLNKKVTVIAVVVALIITALMGSFFHKEVAETAQGMLVATVVDTDIEIMKGQSDENIIANAPFAVEFTYDGQRVNSKFIEASTDAKGIAAELGSKDVTYKFSYKEASAIVTLHYSINEEEPVAPAPGTDGNKSAVVKKDALKTPIKEAQISIKGRDDATVSNKGFHEVDLDSDVHTSSKTPEDNGVCGIIDPVNPDKGGIVIVEEDEVLTDTEVDTIFGSSDSEVTDAVDEVEDASKGDEVEVNDDLNNKVDDATSSEVETEVDENGEITTTTPKVDADLIVVKLSNGEVINLTSNLSGNVDGATVRLAQQADGGFINLATGELVDFNLGQSSQRIIDGFSTPVTVYSTNAGLYYVA